MLPKPNQNFVENGQQPVQQLLPGRRAGFAEEPAVRLPARLQRLIGGSLLLPHQRHHVPRIRERLDLRSVRPGAAGSIPRTARGTSGRTPATGRAPWARPSSTRRSRPTASTRSTSSADSSSTSRPTSACPPTSTSSVRRGAAARCPRSPSAATSLLAAGCPTATPRPTCRASQALPPSRGRHTLHGGVDVRRAQRDRTGGGNRSGQLNFDRTYTRQFSDEATLTPSNLGLSLAAFELGLPTSATINDTVASSFSNYWMGTFAQDTWRLGRFTLNTGLRFEYETGVREENGQMIVGFDPTARLAITDAAQAGLPGKRPPEPAGDARDAHRARRSDLRQRRRTVRPRLQGAGDVDAARLGVLPDRRPHRAQGRLRSLLRHAERVRLRGGAGGLQRHDDVHDLRRSGSHVQVGDAGDRRQRASIRSRSAPTARAGTRWSAMRSASTRCWAGPSPRRTACASTPASSAGACRSSGSSRRVSASRSPTPGPTTTSSR